MYLYAWNTFLLILFCLHIIFAILFQEIFESIDMCFLATTMIIKTAKRSL